MSSPKAGKTTAKVRVDAAKAGKPPKGAKPAKVAKSEKASKAASGVSTAADRPYVGEDKVNFVKAIWEGVPSKGAKAEKAKAEKAKGDKPKAAKSKAAKSGADKSPKVEILRKISAPARVETRQTAESKQALALVAALEAKFEAGELEVLTPEATQALVGVICKIYGANQESGNKYPLLSGRAAVTGTDAMITCSALLKAVDLQVFELGMWQSWSGV
jgi:hypothetical protein